MSDGVPRDVREAAADVLMHWIETRANVDWSDVGGALARHWGDNPRPDVFVDAVWRSIRHQVSMSRDNPDYSAEFHRYLWSCTWRHAYKFLAFRAAARAR